MKIRIVPALVALFSLSVGVSARPQAPQASKNDSSALRFTIVKELPITSVKNQNRSGDCWDYATLSFLESEALRINGSKLDTSLFLSPMFVVWKSYSEKASLYVRRDGNSTFSPGGSPMDVIHAVRDYGIVPNSQMPGIFFGQPGPVSEEMDAVLQAYVKAVDSNPNGKLSPIWHDGFNAILDTYLGKCPESFSVKGREYNPKSYFESLGIDPDDYVSITSFAHHPWYSQFAVEVPDNWRSDLSYNVPVDDMMDIIHNAIENGYTVSWDADMSEKGFGNNGIARIPDAEGKAKEMSDTDMARWLSLPRAVRDAEFAGWASDPTAPEKVCSDADRLADFNDKTTTDDHVMHLYGTAKDQHGTPYFIIKNSWGPSGNYKGMWYISENYLRAKTICILVHKDSIPKAIRQKLGI